MKRGLELKTSFEETISTVHLTWDPPTGEGKNKAFFSNLGESDCFGTRPRRIPLQSDFEKEEKRRLELKTSFEGILLETGFNLVKFSLSVYSAFQESGVRSRCVSPSSVMEFYKTFNNEDPLCRIGSIYVDVGETPFKNIDLVALVLKYCKVDEHFLENLPGLPLLVTQDNRLQEFSTSDPKFLSCHHGILPECKEMFVHNRVRIQIFGDASCLQLPVFKRFGVQDFSSNLHRTLPSEYCGANGYVKWSPTQSSIPNQTWVYKVWTFLNEEAKDVMKEIESSKREVRSFCEIEDLGIRSIRALLQPLLNWSILPCTETIQMPRSHSESASGVVPEHFLVPLILAQSVLDFTGYDANSLLLVEALRMLSLAELNDAVLLDSFYLARKLVASLKTPASLVTSLEQKMRTCPQALQGKLKNAQCMNILQYFSDNVANLQEGHKNVLRRLPFYQATHGGLISVNSTRVCVLPIDIPRKEMEELGLQLHVVFLEGWSSLSPLFKFLEFECVSAVDVYCNFILKYFGIFSTEGRLAHLEYIRNSILLPSSSNENDKQRLLACLRNTAVVTSKDGSLKKASSYYNPHNDVFKNDMGSAYLPL